MTYDIQMTLRDDQRESLRPARNRKRHTRLSRFLSLVLRHKPEAVGVTLDEAGWVDVDVLVAACKKAKKPITRILLEQIVAQDEKGRYAFTEDGQRIRANQGHSVNVSLGYERCQPPARLYHGTHRAAHAAIMRTGLKKVNRHHVHLSAKRATATQVGGRRGKVVLFEVAAQTMHAEGYAFYRSANGVWLVDEVPPRFLTSI